MSKFEEKKNIRMENMFFQNNSEFLFFNFYENYT